MPLLGHFDGEPVILVRQGEQVFATGAVCTHYGGPLAEGLVVGETDPVSLAPCAVQPPYGRGRRRSGAQSHVLFQCPASGRYGHDRREESGRLSGRLVPLNPSSVVIVGAGAAGAACADMLRAKGYAGPVTLAGDEEPGPVDRPNLSKDFLAGTADEDWIPLRTREYYESIQVELVTDDPAVRIGPADHQVSLRSGRNSATARCCWRPGRSLARFRSKAQTCRTYHRLRTLADSKAIIAKAQTARTARSSAPALSDWKWPRRSAIAGSQYRSSARTRFRWARFWVRNWAVSFRNCTSSTGSVSS